MKGTVLIVDDEKQLTDNLKIILHHYVDSIFVSNNPVEALNIIRQENINCVISDMYMPEMTGLELIKTVREDQNPVPFIFFSAYGQDEIKREVSQFEQTTFITKPAITDLVNALEPMLKLGLKA